MTATTGTEEGLVRVLLVDDQELVRSGLRRILRRRDGVVVVGECEDGDQVDAAVREHRPDVVVSREDVPELDGYELCSIIRSDPSTKALPFLLLASPAGPRTGAAARAGVDLVLGGTFDSADIVNRVQRLAASGGHHA